MLSPLRKSLSHGEIIDNMVVVVRFALKRYGTVGPINIKFVLAQSYTPFHKIDQIEEGAAYRDKPAKVLHLGGVDRLVPNGFFQKLRVMYLVMFPSRFRDEEHVVDVYSKDIAWQMVNLDYLHSAANRNRSQKYKF